MPDFEFDKVWVVVCRELHSAIGPFVDYDIAERVASEMDSVAADDPDVSCSFVVVEFMPVRVGEFDADDGEEDEYTTYDHSQNWARRGYL